ncbi:MAG: Hsp70 family protein [Acidobacteriota bacterium]|nr:Hsp70 family protein [Acidobacteriota bacterium]
MTRIVGIDLGTTNSLCAVFDAHQGPVLIPNAVGSVLTPSVVGLLDDGRILTGYPAREMSVTRPERTAARFKRFMGTDDHRPLGDQKFSAPELSSVILKTLVQDARAHLGYQVTDAVITVPAYFNDNQRNATKLAGELAGLKVRRIINEPTAAALTYGYHEKEADKKILVFDLGGGTFDVTLMEIFEGTLEIIATAGRSQLGGEDFTESLTRHVLTEAGMEPERVEELEPLRYTRLRKLCEQAKIQLSDEEEVKIALPDAEGKLAENGDDITITRAAFADLCAPLLDRLKQPIARTLRDGECTPNEVQDIILVGGATRMYLVHQFLADYFGKQPMCKHNPDEVVAMGAAVQAALMDDHEAVEEMVMTDVCPFTLGVEVSKRLGSSVRDGYYLPIIHRNTTVPVSKEEVVATLYDNQSQVMVKVYQGESRKTKENLMLGELEVNGIPPGPAGQPIYIRFTYDMNGILEVEAIVHDSGLKFQTVLTHHVKGLNEQEIQRAVDRMQEVKFYPRDELRHQHLLHYAEQVIGEVNPMERERLEEALDQFEQALFDTDRELFEHRRGLLLETLDNMGYAFDDPEDL